MKLYQCQSSGKMPECSGCHHATPHEWREDLGCANMTWCLDKLKKAIGWKPGDPAPQDSFACAEVGATPEPQPEPAAEEGEL